MKFVCLRYPKLQMTMTPDVKTIVNGEVIKQRAHLIQFSDGYFDTTDEKEIAFIKKHTEYGVHIHPVEDMIQRQEASDEEMKVIERHRGRPRKIV